MDSYHPAGHWGGVPGAHHLLATHKGVSEVCCNAACQVIQLVRAVVNEADDGLFIYSWELLQGRHRKQLKVNGTRKYDGWVAA